MLKAGLARGCHDQGAPEALRLVDCMIANAVRCVPPQNKPTPKEVATCRPFLLARIAALPNLVALLAIGRIAHDSILDALQLKRVAFPFAHGARHALPDGLILFDTYHCSRRIPERVGRDDAVDPGDVRESRGRGSGKFAPKLNGKPPCGTSTTRASFGRGGQGRRPEGDPMAGLEISPTKVGFVIVKAREIAAKVAAWDATARTERTNRTNEYLLGMPLLPDYLEEALDRLGYSVEDAEDDAL